MVEVSLYWPPVRRLYDCLVSPAGDSEQTGLLLKRYDQVLSEGLAFFKRQSDQCRKAVQEQTFLFAGDGPKIPLRPELKAAAISLSNATVRGDQSILPLQL